MRKAGLLLLSIVIFSCNLEKHTIHRAQKHRDRLMQIAAGLIEQHKNDTANEIFLGAEGTLDRATARFLQRKVKTIWVHIIYGPAKGFIDTDSVIIFTRNGIPLLGMQHNILIDYKTVPRNQFNSCGSCTKALRIGERMFYLAAPMPPF